MKLTAILFLFTLLSQPALAQNSDLGLLVGVNAPRGNVTIGERTVVEGSVGGSTQINYAWQFRKAHATDLYVELPLVISLKNTTVITDREISFGGGTFFFTPGVRLKLHVQSRVAIYAAAGGGLGSFFGLRTVTGQSVTVSTKRTVTIAGDFAGGIDFRLTRLLSLRFEARDFLSEPGLGGTVGRHHAIYQGGVGFHF